MRKLLLAVICMVGLLFMNISFADDFEFLGPQMAQYKMIGNAVPSEFARIIAIALHKVFDKYC